MIYIKQFVRPILAGLLIASLSCILAMPSQAGGPYHNKINIKILDVGFNSTYRVGNWTPVRIMVEAERGFDGTMSVIVPDGDGVPSRVTQEIHLADHDRKIYQLYVRFGRVDSDLTVTIEETNLEIERGFHEKIFHPDETGTYRPSVSAENSLLVTVGQGNELLKATLRTTNKATADHTTFASVVDPTNLPHDWIGYEGVDTLFLALSNPATAEMVFTPNDPRWKAIDQWVRRGGRLVLLGGAVDPELIEKVAKKNYNPNASLLPGKPAGIATLKQVTSLETYVETSVPIPRSPEQRRPQIPAFELTDVQGTVPIRADNVPVLVQNSHGFGMVTFLGIDMNASPLDQWQDRGRLMVKLLGMPSKTGDSSQLDGGAVRHLGFTDLSGQMRSALDRFDGVSLIPFGLVILIVLLYVTLIGPVDYFLLKKIGRMSWTWLTFTLVAILVGMGIFGFAYRMKGDRLRLHRIDLVDVDTSSQMIRGTSWANLFSPEGKRYDLALSSQLPSHLSNQNQSMLFSWLGLPGQGLGGMNPRAGEGSVWRKPYDFATDHTTMQHVPVLNWSTKSFTARWSDRWSGNFDFQLKEEDELLIGNVTNPLQDQTLYDCLLVYDRWAYPIGTIRPGESIYVDGLRDRTKLNTLLTGRKMVIDTEDNDKFREKIEPYNTESVDPTYVLRMMMFYEAGGGVAYTGLSNRYQPFVDLSHLLGPGRAMLVGRLPSEAPAATQLTVDGEPVDSDQHATYFRFIIPVEVKAKTK